MGSGRGRRTTGNAATHRFQTDLVAALTAAALLLSSAWAAAQPRRGTGPVRNPYAWPSLDELVERSDTIVAGEVLNVRSAWTADRREIFTTVTLRPDRRFKGGERSLIRFRIPGGTVGDTRLTVTHAPVFGVGEQVLVFMAGESGRLPRVVGGEAGKRHIRVGRDGDRTILPGFAVTGAGAGGASGLGALEDVGVAIGRLMGRAGSARR